MCGMRSTSLYKFGTRANPAFDVGRVSHPLSQLTGGPPSGRAGGVPSAARTDPSARSGPALLSAGNPWARGGDGGGASRWEEAEAEGHEGCRPRGAARNFQPNFGRRPGCAECRGGAAGAPGFCERRGQGRARESRAPGRDPLPMLICSGCDREDARSASRHAAGAAVALAVRRGPRAR